MDCILTSVITIVCLASWVPYTSCVTHCVDGMWYGTIDINTYTDDDNLDKGMLLTGEEYRMDCCGIVDRWEIVISKDAQLKIQMWETVADYLGIFKFIDEIVVDAVGTNVDGQNLFIIDYEGKRDKQLHVEDLFVPGWHSPGGDIVVYAEGCGSLCNQEFYWENLGGSTPATYGQVDVEHTFSSTPNDHRRYAIKWRVAPSDTPTFTNVPSTFESNCLEEAGDIIATIEATDINIREVLRFHLTSQTPDQGLFTLEETGEIKFAQSPTGDELSEYTIVLSVSDGCNELSGTVTLIVDCRETTTVQETTTEETTTETTTTSTTTTPAIPVVDVDPTIDGVNDTAADVDDDNTTNIVGNSDPANNVTAPPVDDSATSFTDTVKGKAIIGGSVGGFLLLLILAIVAVYCTLKAMRVTHVRKQKNKARKAEERRRREEEEKKKRESQLPTQAGSQPSGPPSNGQPPPVTQYPGGPNPVGPIVVQNAGPLPPPAVTPIVSEPPITHPNSPIDLDKLGDMDYMTPVDSKYKNMDLSGDNWWEKI